MKDPPFATHRFPRNPRRLTMFTLDIGGEGRHPDAWNLNPSSVKTLGAAKGARIPRRIPGRAEAIPLPDQSVDRIIMEKTPLRTRAIKEILRVVSPHGEIVLRHVPCPWANPHELATRLIRGLVEVRDVDLDGQLVQETTFRLSAGVEGAS